VALWAGIKFAHGVSYGISSKVMLDAAHHHEQPVQIAYAPTAALRKIESRKSLVGGPSMNGLIEPYLRSPSRLEPLTHPTQNSNTEQMQTHLQGSEVDVAGYYQSLVGSNYKGLRIQTGWNPRRVGPETVKVGSGNPHRLYSSFSLGDRFYFNGAHMFNTTYVETTRHGLGQANIGDFQQG